MPISEGSEPHDHVFVVKELEGPNGGPPRTIAFTDVDIRPLSYDQLATTKLHQSVTVPLEMSNGRVVDTDIDGVDTSRYANFRMTLESPFTSKAISLVRGGWLPSGLAAHRAKTIVLVDRNVVTEIVSRFAGGSRRGREPDFLDIFGDQHVRINPLLYAMEGNTRCEPGPELVAAQLEEVTVKLRSALPKARLQVGPGSTKGILGLIKDTRAGMERRTAFLTRLAPALKSPVGHRLRDRRWNEVLEAARECAVPLNSLVVLAALSTVAVPGGASPAKALLKFKHGYNETDAYNALADLRSLEVLTHLLALFPDEIVQLCTADRNLALFWTGIRASNFVRTGTGVSFDLDPIDRLLPGDTQGRWRDVTS